MEPEQPKHGPGGTENSTHFRIYETINLNDKYQNLSSPNDLKSRMEKP